jgi:hypothetical protein
MPLQNAIILNMPTQNGYTRRCHQNAIFLFEYAIKQRKILKKLDNEKSPAFHLKEATTQLLQSSLRCHNKLNFETTLLQMTRF